MAEKGLTVRMKTDTSGFKKGMDEVVEELNKYNKALIDNQYKQRDANKAISEAQREIKNLKKAEEDRAKQLENEKKRREELNKIIDDTNEELNRLDSIKSKDGQLSKEQEKLYKSLSNTMQKAFQELDKLTMTEEKKTKLDEDGKKKIEELNGTIEEEKIKLSQLHTEQASLRNVISQTTQSLTDNNDKWTVLKGTLANLASDTIKKLASSLANIARDVVQTGEQFSASMSEVGAISGATADELKELEQAARLYGATTKFSATEAADALKYMALAGWDSQQAIAGLPAVLDLAAASGMDLGRASDIVTDYITAFGLEVEDASRFVDIMSYAMSHSNTTTEMLGEAYKNCAATAKSMGFSVEETTSALMTMANAGVKGGEAGTTLNTLMTRLATNTKGCADELKKYGVEIYDSQGNMHSLSEIMNGLISAFSGLTQEQQANLSKMIAGTNQYAGFQTLMQGMSEKVKAAGMSFEDYTAALKECDGASSDMAKTMSDNLSGDLKALDSALDELKLKLYDDAETPLRNLVKLGKDGVVPAIDGIIKHLKEILPYIVGASTALATLKLNLSVGKIVAEITKDTEAVKKALQGLTVATQAETVAQEQLNIAMKANVIGLVITAVVSLTSAIGTLVAMNQDNSNSFENSNTKAKNYLRTLQNLKAEADKRIEDVQAEGKALKDLQNEYDNLRTKADMTAEEESRLDTVAGELAKTLGISTQALKNKNGAYTDITGSVDKYIEKLEEQTRLENSTNGLKEAYTAYDKAKDACEEYSKKIKEQQEIVDDNTKYVDALQKQFDETSFYDGRWKKRLWELDSAKKELESQKSILNDLKGVQAGYQTQMITATGSAIEYKKALGQVVDEEKEWEQCGKDMNSTAEETAKTFSKLNQAENDNTEVTETATKKTETLSEKYKRLNGLLEENQKAVKAVNDEIEQAMDSGDAEHLKELQDKLKDLNSENTTLKNRIKDVTDEINKDASAIADAIENVESSMQMLQKAEKEVTDNGKLSLNTLNSIQKKYPQLVDLVNDYINGIKTEKDVIEGLKGVYERDIENYNQAVAVKVMKQNGFTEDVAKSVVELVNTLKDDYGIDVQNFANANEVKKAALESLKAKAEETQKIFNEFWAENNFDIDMTNGNMNYIAKDDVTKQWRQATQAEIERYKAILAARDKAFDNYYTFDTEGVQKYMDLYKPVSADSLLDLSGSGSSSGGSKNKDAVTLSGDGVTASGDTYTKAYMTWIDRMKALGKMSDESEIYHLEQLKKRTDNTAEEIYQIDLKLYNARKKLAEESAKNLADVEKKSQDELQERLNLAKAAYEAYVNGKIDAQRKIADEAKKSADAEIAALDAVMKKRNEEKEDQKRKAEINKIDERLKYNRNQLTDMEKTDLYHRKQDLLNEQYEADFQRSIEQQKADIQANANRISLNAENAVSNMQNNLSAFINHLAVLTGTQTAAQKVINNNQQQNIQIVKNALSDDQLVQKLIRESQKYLYTG